MCVRQLKRERKKNKEREKERERKETTVSHVKQQVANK